MRKYGRIDGNQGEIVRALRQLGASVVSTAPVGDGFPDIVIGLRGKNVLAEVKDPSQVPSKRTLTEMEKEFHSGWRGQIAVVHTIEEALDLLKSEGLL